MWSQLWDWNWFWCSCFWANSSLHLAYLHWCPGLFAVIWSEILPRNEGFLLSKVTANICVGELSKKLALTFLGFDLWLVEVLGMAVVGMPPVRNNLPAEPAGWCVSVLWWFEVWLKQAVCGCWLGVLLVSLVPLALEVSSVGAGLLTCEVRILAGTSKDVVW